MSISQPWVRPIYKEWQLVPLNIGIYIYISYKKESSGGSELLICKFSEISYLEDQIEAYNDRYGYYPLYANSNSISSIVLFFVSGRNLVKAIKPTTLITA